MDASTKKNRFKNLNKYSWLMLISYIFAAFAMSHQTVNTYEFMQALPLIILFVFWSERTAPLIKKTDCNLKKTQLFSRDTFILSFSFLLGSLISLLFAYDNSDAKGWWVLLICFISLYGFIFSLIFSGMALLIKNHKTYTFVFSLLIMGQLSMGTFLPHYVCIPLTGCIDTFYVITCILLIIHCFFAIHCKMN